MLRLWLSTDRKKNSKRIFDKICATKQKGQILLVPDQFSHMAERQLGRLGGPSINRYAEVLSFSRLASRVFSEVGGSARTQTDAAGKLMMMSLAVEQVRSRLKLYGACAEKPAFLLKLLDTIEELRSFCVTTDSLHAIAAQTGSVLAVKMEEFALLMESYESVCANLGQNPETRLTQLLHTLDGSDFASGKQIYIDAFSDFNGVEKEIIAQLLNGGAQITVALHCDAMNSQLQQFSSAAEAGRGLQRMAQKQNLPVEIEIFDDVQESPLYELKKQFFAGKCSEYTDKTDEIAFIEGVNATDECRIAAGQILKLIEDGARWRDITIACGDYANYRRVLESVFRSAKIPAYYAGTTDILQQSVIHMLLSALEAATGGMETDAVLAYLKSGFLTIPRQRCDRLENYIFLWNIQGSQWESEWTKSPFGVTKKAGDRGEKQLALLNEDRVKYVMPLVSLRNGLRSAKNTAQMLESFNRFMEQIGLCEQLGVMAKQLTEQNELQKAQEYAQVYAIVCRLLEQMYGVLGTSARSVEAFYQMFRTALSQCSVGTIPASLDCVNVGNLLSQRRGQSKYLFLLGANEGSFPTAQSNHSLLSDVERTTLIEYGIGIAPMATSGLHRELSAMAGVLEVPSERLYFGGINGQESYYLLRAKNLFPNAERVTDDTPLITRSERDYLKYLAANPEAIAGANAQQAQAEALVRAQQHEIGKLSAQTVESLYGKTLRLSSSKIDTLASCRFSHFLKYGLKAEERKPAQMDPASFGDFVHDVLEYVAERIMQEGGFETVTLERAMELTQERMLWYMHQVLGELWNSEREEYLFVRSFAEVREVVTQMYNELSISKFRPQWFELQFGEGKLMPSVKIVGEKITAELEGAVDRADIWKDGDRLYVRVIDYKTGSTTFEPEKILHGIGLQMLLYLFALRRNGQHLLDAPLHCAGVLYFPAKVKKVPIDGKYDAKAEIKRMDEKRRSGLLLEQEQVLQAMEPSQEPIYLPKKKCFANAQQFALMEDFVFRVVAGLADELADGRVTANPYYQSEQYNACGKCDYAEICQSQYEKRWIDSSIKMDEFWQRVEEVCGNGEV